LTRETSCLSSAEPALASWGYSATTAVSAHSQPLSRRGSSRRARRRSVGMGTITLPAVQCDELATTMLAVKGYSDNKSVRLSPCSHQGLLQGFKELPS